MNFYGICEEEHLLGRRVHGEIENERVRGESGSVRNMNIGRLANFLFICFFLKNIIKGQIKTTSPIRVVLCGPLLFVAHYGLRPFTFSNRFWEEAFGGSGCITIFLISEGERTSRIESHDYSDLFLYRFDSTRLIHYPKLAFCMIFTLFSEIKSS